MININPYSLYFWNYIFDHKDIPNSGKAYIMYTMQSLKYEQ